ncbi:MAG: glycosyltransferase family 2 protein [Verrucomicrobiae bacterium]|nr:glycosyltransferase family 2 protein [Verrucomicrobiae bacterium]
MIGPSCIVMPAYRAGKVLAETVSRIPKDFGNEGGTLFIINDACPEDTGKVADAIAAGESWIRAIHHQNNLGYGGAQKTGLRAGMEAGCKGFAVVHADGQYAPERVLDLLRPILAGDADLVQGSRMLAGGAREGGMPLSRYLANRALTGLENLAFGTRLAEFHSGYMVYSRTLLERIPFESLQNNFNFDAEMILMGHLAGFPCLEIPIPTHYGEESSSLDPIPYGMNVLRMIMRHWGGHYRNLLREDEVDTAHPKGFVSSGKEVSR